MYSWNKIYDFSNTKYTFLKNQEHWCSGAPNLLSFCIRLNDSFYVLTGRSWERLYEIPPKYCRKAGQKAGQNRELMLRPPYPRWCGDNYIPEYGQKMDVVAVVINPWKVGDLVDWWHNSCFWTGKIIELLGVDKVKVSI
jgi:hypothetical protein